MTEITPWEFDARSDRLFIHFDVEEHFLKLETFVETAESTKKVIEALNTTFFKGSLDYELVVLPPESGTFLSKLAVLLGVPGAVFYFLNTDIGVTSRKVVRLFLEQLRLEFVPVLHGLQGRLAAQG